MEALEKLEKLSKGKTEEGFVYTLHPLIKEEQRITAAENQVKKEVADKAPLEHQCLPTFSSLLGYPEPPRLTYDVTLAPPTLPTLAEKATKLREELKKKRDELQEFEKRRQRDPDSIKEEEVAAKKEEELALLPKEEELTYLELLHKADILLREINRSEQIVVKFDEEVIQSSRCVPYAGPVADAFKFVYRGGLPLKQEADEAQKNLDKYWKELEELNAKLIDKFHVSESADAVGQKSKEFFKTQKVAAKVDEMGNNILKILELLEGVNKSTSMSAAEALEQRRTSARENLFVAIATMDDDPAQAKKNLRMLLFDFKDDLEVLDFRNEKLELPAVFFAVLNNMPKVVDQLCDAGASINEVFSSQRSCTPAPRAGWTPLAYAAKCGFDEVVGVLLKYKDDQGNFKANPNLASRISGYLMNDGKIGSGLTPMTFAIDTLVRCRDKEEECPTEVKWLVLDKDGGLRERSINIVRSLLAAGGNVSSDDLLTLSLSDVKNFDLLLFVLQHDTFVRQVDWTDAGFASVGITVLNRAAESGRRDIADVMLKNGVDVDAVDLKTSTSALQIAIDTAAKMGAPKTEVALPVAGAVPPSETAATQAEATAAPTADPTTEAPPASDAAAADAAGSDAAGAEAPPPPAPSAEETKRAGLRSCVELFVGVMATVKPEYLYQAAADANLVDILKALVMQRFPAPPKKWYSCFQKKHDPTPNLNFFQEPEGTPLHWASKSGNTLAVRALLDLGADCNLFKDEAKTTPMFAALQSGKEEAVEELLKAPSKVNLLHLDAKGKSLAFLAAQLSLPRALLAILKAAVARKLQKKLIDLPSLKGNTPTFAAAKKGNLSCLLLLRRFGSDLNIANNDGDTALSWATANEQRQLEEEEAAAKKSKKKVVKKKPPKKKKGAEAEEQRTLEAFLQPTPNPVEDDSLPPEDTDVKVRMKTIATLLKAAAPAEGAAKKGCTGR